MMTDKPQVLIVTRSDDNHCIQTVSEQLMKRGAQPLRLNTDRYPDLFRVSTTIGGGQSTTRQIAVGDDVVDLDRLAAVWYRRFHAGAALPESLGDMRQPSVQESRRTLFGFIAGLPCFHLDPLESVRRCDHKELQLERAQALGLDVPRTLITNDPAAVRPFFDACDGRIITKMQHSFAIYREGIENVVFTNVIDEQQLDDLEGLKYCPMTFQEHLEKVVELRVTVVGTKVMCASIDSTRQENTAIDWRRDGVGLINDWKPYELPKAIADGLVALLGELGLNYGAADFIVTPDGRTLFLEVNAVGEFFWLDRNPGLPISETIAEVLLGEAPRNPVNVDAWRNDTGPVD
jgi:glutathione synthase/RimK-type ligase-like ATP-grasp enzyme